jgi:hypothetical protein
LVLKVRLVSRETLVMLVTRQMTSISVEIRVPLERQEQLDHLVLWVSLE